MIKVTTEWDLGLKHNSGRMGFYKDVEIAKKEIFELCEDLDLFETLEIEDEFEGLIKDGLIQFKEVDDVIENRAKNS